MVRTSSAIVVTGNDAAFAIGGKAHMYDPLPSSGEEKAREESAQSLESGVLHAKASPFGDGFERPCHDRAVATAAPRVGEASGLVELDDPATHDAIKARGLAWCET
jgi:hypothetical protein